jgi:hypothetical protein
MSLLEHQFYFKANVRKALLLSFVGVSVVALGYWVVLPLARYFRLGAVISHEKAAEIIGSHFGDVKDKLLNILQLKHQSEQAEQRDLIMASINQKSDEIRVVSV